MKTEKPLSEIGDSYVEMPLEQQYCSAKEIWKGIEDIGPFSEKERKIVSTALTTTHHRLLNRTYLTIQGASQKTATVDEIRNLITELQEIVKKQVKNQPIFINYVEDYLGETDDEGNPLDAVVFSWIDRTQGEKYDLRGINNIKEMITNSRKKEEEQKRKQEESIKKQQESIERKAKITILVEKLQNNEITVDEFANQTDLLRFNN